MDNQITQLMEHEKQISESDTLFALFFAREHSDESLLELDGNKGTYRYTWYYSGGRIRSCVA